MCGLLNAFLFILFLMSTATAEESPQLSPQELEEWFQDDERLHPYDKKSDDGKLIFLKAPPVKRTPFSQNVLTIHEHALRSGWVEIEQCHEQLDPVSAVEVVYRYRQMRGLRIIRYSHIGKAWVDGQSIQLEDVQKGAMLCMQAEARILYKRADGRFILHNGPFQRRFLDSYFPMHVTLTIQYPAHLLYFSKVSPTARTGFEVKKESGLIHIDSWFEGKLMIELEFRSVI